MTPVELIKIGEKNTETRNTTKYMAEADQLDAALTCTLLEAGTKKSYLYSLVVLLTDEIVA